ncbi:type III secretion system needle tip protein SipD, partial [Salmonella enterica subsp. enterica serovar Bareilly]|nr:type III secretion system needle tip protein SipD [Salmonella enterica subsp. enterica serovar Bareilly]
ELNLPEACLKPAGAGYVVLVDLAPVQKMVDDLNGLGTPGSDSKLEMDNAKYQAWQSGFKAQEENMKTTLQTLTQKYSNANSLYDNLVKVLSSTISSCMEAAKSFLQR